MPDARRTRPNSGSSGPICETANAGAPELAAPELTVHAALIDGSPSSALRGPEGLVAMIAQIRAAFPRT
jgi:hypothetical protein